MATRDAFKLLQRPAGPMSRSVSFMALAMLVVAGSVRALDATGQRLADALDRPPARYALPQKATVTGIAASGSTLVAVGPRGVILRSADAGGTWQQVLGPVSADLTSVRFSAANTVWAVGHDAVILKSVDAGVSWSRVLDGRLLLKTLQQAAQANARQAKEVERTMSQSASPDVWPTAILDLMFLDADRGFAVGSFGLLLATTDGGKTWQAWTDRADNERQFHLYAIRGDAKRPYIAGEQGLLLRLDEAGQRFVKVETPYNGSYFGVEADGSQLLAYGLRGNAYLSSDEGRTWRRLETGTDANLVGAGLRNDGFWLASQKGDILVGNLQASKLSVASSSPGADLYGAVAIDAGRFAAARLSGVASITARQSP